MQEKLDGILRLAELAPGWDGLEAAADGACRFDADVRWFLERPQLLDGILGRALEPLLCHATKDVAAQAVTRPWVYHMLYALLDVRGRAGTEQFLPKEVSSLEPTLLTLEGWVYGVTGRKDVATAFGASGGSSGAGSVPGTAPTGDTFIASREEHADDPGFSQVNTRTFLSDTAFRVTYCLLSFLRSLLSIPFDISTVSPRPSLCRLLEADPGAAGRPEAKGTFEMALYAVLGPALRSSGRAQFLAAETLARFAMRPDQRGVFLPFLLGECNVAITAYLGLGCRQGGGGVARAAAGTVGPVGVASAVGSASAAPAAPAMPAATPSAQAICGVLATLCYAVRYGDREHTLTIAQSILRDPETVLRRLLESSSREVRRLSLVLSTRLATLYLRAPFRWSLRESINSLEELRGFSVPPEFDFYVDTLLLGLADRDGSLRSASARCLASIVQKLPKLFADEVIDAVVSYFSPAETAEAWHGGMLTLAELIRRHLLLQERLLQVFPWVLQAFRFNRASTASANASIVRDTACYVVWALARAYSGGVALELAPDLARELLVLACFDREINIRRAAAAAFQELAGRLREPFVPAAVLCSAAVDYFELGSLSNAYLSVAPRIARQDRDYAEALLQALAERYAGHCSPDVRSLAARAIPQLIRVYLGVEGGPEASAVSGGAEAPPGQSCDAQERRAFVASYVSDLRLELQGLDRREDWMRHAGLCLIFAELFGACEILCSVGAGESLMAILKDKAVFAPGLAFSDNAEANSYLMSAGGRLLTAICRNLGNGEARGGSSEGEARSQGVAACSACSAGISACSLKIAALENCEAYFEFLRSVFNSAVLTAVSKAGITDIDVFFRAPVVAAMGDLLRWVSEADLGGSGQGAPRSIAPRVASGDLSSDAARGDAGATVGGSVLEGCSQALLSVRKLLSLDFFSVEFETEFAKNAFLSALPPRIILSERRKILSTYSGLVKPPLGSASYPSRMYCLYGCRSLVQCLVGREGCEAITGAGASGDTAVVSEIAAVSEEILRVFSACLADYTADIRGDVGALVRLYALRTLRGLVRGFHGGENSPSPSLAPLKSSLEGLYQDYLVRFLGSRQAFFRAEMLESLAADIADEAYAIAEVSPEEICRACPYVSSRVAGERRRAAESTASGAAEEPDDHIFDMHLKGAGEGPDPVDAPGREDGAAPASAEADALAGEGAARAALEDQFALAATAPLPSESREASPSLQAVKLLLTIFLPTQRFQRASAEALIFCSGFRGDPAALYVSELVREAWRAGGSGDAVADPQLRDAPGSGWNIDLFFNIITQFASAIPPGNYSAMFAEASALFLESMISNGVIPDSDEKLFRLLNGFTLLLKAKNYASFYSHVITGLSACACALAPQRDRYPRSFSRAVKGLIIRLSAKVVKHRNGAAEGLAELVAYWPSVLAAGAGGAECAEGAEEAPNAGRREASSGHALEKAMEKALALLLQHDWANLEVKELEPLREEVCGLLGIDAPRARGTG